MTQTQLVEDGHRWTGERFARAVKELQHADDPQLHMAGTLANLMIFARNRDMTPRVWQSILDKFCEVAKIKQEESPMGELIWVSDAGDEDS